MRLLGVSDRVVLSQDKRQADVSHSTSEACIKYIEKPS